MKSCLTINGSLRIPIAIRSNLLMVISLTVSPALVYSQSLNVLSTAESRVAVKEGLQFLANQQNADGSFGSSRQSLDAGVCSLCGLAFLSEGSTPGRGPFGVEVAKCVDYVLSCSDDVGFIASGTEGIRPMYGHGFSTLFLADVYGMAPQDVLREQLSKAVQLTIRSQNDDGGWRYQPTRNDADLSVTVCQIMALRAARNAGFYVPHKVMDNAIQYVRGCQNSDGGFAYQQSGGPSMFSRSAAAVAAFYCVGNYRANDLQKAQAFLDQNPLSPNHRVEQEYFYYGQYYATFSMLQRGRIEYGKWYPEIRDQLVRRRDKSTGAWENTVWSSEYSTAIATIILQSPYGRLPIFER